MRGAEDLFEALENHYKQGLPFVVYSRPINSVIKSWLQKDDAVYETSDFTESGFVFAPFDLNNKTILFKDTNAEHYSIEVDHLEVVDASETSVTEPEKSRSSHIRLIEEGIEDIENNRFKKIVLSRHITVDVKDANPFQIFKRLFNTYKNAMVYCWYHPKVGLWLGATPELLFKVEGLNVTTISLAGTKPYDENNTEQWTPKEREEQKIVTDYIDNQLRPFSKSVAIKNVETVRAGSLIHLKTRILARLESSNFKLKSIINALHPTPAVCGFPKDATQQFISSKENYNREFYTGFLGELNLIVSNTRNSNRKNVENNAYKTVKRCSNFYVNLRCMQIKNSSAILYVGGGITKDSIPEDEWQETVAKSKTMLKVL
ncbi:chorismate-binding protein [Winogradskyella sp. A3E31]|uniref:chorismate-binding protein n=1 Tax=Winogradskyella sp. A3E31 TaxID=3349637 RepID=UPI00398BA941